MAKMKKDQHTYKEAYQELESILHSIQNETLDLDTMADSIRRAKELVKFCQDKLRNIQGEISDMFQDSKEESQDSD